MLETKNQDLIKKLEELKKVEKSYRYKESYDELIRILQEGINESKSDDVVVLDECCKIRKTDYETYIKLVVNCMLYLSSDGFIPSGVGLYKYDSKEIVSPIPFKENFDSYEVYEKYLAGYAKERGIKVPDRGKEGVREPYCFEKMYFLTGYGLEGNSASDYYNDFKSYMLKEMNLGNHTSEESYSDSGEETEKNDNIFVDGNTQSDSPIVGEENPEVEVNFDGPNKDALEFISKIVGEKRKKDELTDEQIKDYKELRYILCSQPDNPMKLGIFTIDYKYYNNFVFCLNSLKLFECDDLELPSDIGVFYYYDLDNEKMFMYLSPIPYNYYSGSVDYETYLENYADDLSMHPDYDENGIRKPYYFELGEYVNGVFKYTNAPNEYYKKYYEYALREIKSQEGKKSDSEQPENRAYGTADDPNITNNGASGLSTDGTSPQQPSNTGNGQSHPLNSDTDNQERRNGSGDVGEPEEDEFDDEVRRPSYSRPDNPTSQRNRRRASDGENEVVDVSANPNLFRRFLNWIKDIDFQLGQKPSLENIKRIIKRILVVILIVAMGKVSLGALIPVALKGLGSLKYFPKILWPALTGSGVNSLGVPYTPYQISLMRKSLVKMLLGVGGAGVVAAIIKRAIKKRRQNEELDDDLDLFDEERLNTGSRTQNHNPNQSSVQNGQPSNNTQQIPVQTSSPQSQANPVSTNMQQPVIPNPLVQNGQSSNGGQQQEQIQVSTPQAGHTDTANQQTEQLSNIQELIAEIKSLRTEVAALKEEIDDLNEKNEKLNDQLKELKQENERLRQENSILLRKVDGYSQFYQGVKNLKDKGTEDELKFYAQAHDKKGNRLFIPGEVINQENQSINNGNLGQLDESLSSGGMNL